MKHLNDDERLAFLEGRAGKDIAAHISECPECSASVQSWRQTIERLEHFEWPARSPRRATIHSPIFKFALAASIVLCIGFALGRFTGPNAAEIQARVKADITRDVQQQLATALHEKQKAEIDLNILLAAVAELRDQQDRNYVTLRKDLETLASNADARIQFTRRQILELAGATENNFQ
jgi:hypothetical protein